MWYTKADNLRQPVLFLVIIFFLFFPYHCLLPSFSPSSLPSLLMKVIPGRKNEFEIRKCGHFLNKKFIALSTNVFFFASCFVLLKYNFPRYYLFELSENPMK